MSVDFESLHDRALERMDRGDALIREGRLEAGREEYERAADLEQQAADTVPEEQPRTRGILRVAAVSLWMRAGRLLEAAGLARRYLGASILTGYARQLHELLSAIEGQRAAMRLAIPIPEEHAAAFLERVKLREERLRSGDIDLVPLPTAA
jgi:hypothetical protein